MKKKVNKSNKICKLLNWSFWGEVICNTIISCCIVYLLASKPFFNIYESIISGKISALEFTLILLPGLLVLQFITRLIEKYNNSKRN